VRFCGVRAVGGCARGSDRLQKSTGGAWPITPAGEEPAVSMSGLASRRVSAAEVTERRKPDRRRQSRETGGGFPHQEGIAKASPWEQPVDERRFGPGKSLSLTRERWKRFWLLAARPEEIPVSGAGRDRRRQRSFVGFVRGPTSRGEVAPPRKRDGRPPLSGREAQRERARAKGPKLEARRQARPSRGAVVERRSCAAERTSRSRWSTSGGLLGREGRTRRSTRRNAARPEVERSAGARVVSRLQKSERGILSTPVRGESRGEPRQRGVARRGGVSPVDEGSPHRVGRKGCEMLHANVTGNAEHLTRP